MAKSRLPKYQICKPAQEEKLPANQTPQQTIDTAALLYKEFQSAAKVGDAMGVSKRTARKYLDRAGLIRGPASANYVRLVDNPCRSASPPGVPNCVVQYAMHGAAVVPAAQWQWTIPAQAAAPTAAPPDIFGRHIAPILPATVLVIPDLQAPYHHQSALPFLDAVAQRFSPDCVVSIGDEVDFGFLSRYEKFPEIDEPARELDAACKFAGDLFRLFPKAHALTSNHVQGRLQSARRVGRLPPQMLVAWKSLIGAPAGWEWYEEVHLGNVLFRHGDKWPKLTTPHLLRDIPRCYGRHMSVVHGHLHSQHGRVGDTILVGDDEYWAAYTGCLIDVRSKAFDYVKAPVTRLGCLVIHHGVPHRIPLRRDTEGRWTGQL